MDLFHLFRRSKKEPLPPFVDKELGELRWEPDAEGWIGAIQYRGEPVELYLGSGATDRYPSEETRHLIRGIAKRIETYGPPALECLIREIGQMKDAPSNFVLSGIETYEHYVEEGVCTFTFSDGVSETIWRMNWRDGKPLSVGFDD